VFQVPPHFAARQKRGFVGVSDIVASIDREIAILRKAREMLSQGAAAGKAAVRSRRVNVDNQPSGAARGQKRRLTPEGRRRIAEAVKRRWELQRKAAAKKDAGSK
jgi:hypothetical protein